jgi:hypothetical protein
MELAGAELNTAWGNSPNQSPGLSPSKNRGLESVPILRCFTTQPGHAESNRAGWEKILPAVTC